MITALMPQSAERMKDRSSPVMAFKLASLRYLYFWRLSIIFSLNSKDNKFEGTLLPEELSA